jgi:hypothetical protein
MHLDSTMTTRSESSPLTREIRYHAILRAYCACSESESHLQTLAWNMGTIAQQTLVLVRGTESPCQASEGVETNPF